MSASDSGYSTSAVSATSACKTRTPLPSVDVDDEGGFDALRLRRRRLRTTQSSSESMGGGLEFTAPSSVGAVGAADDGLGDGGGFLLATPTEGEVLDVLKLAYILQATSLRQGDLPLLPAATHDLWSELRERLVGFEDSPLSRCYVARNEEQRAGVILPGAGESISEDGIRRKQSSDCRVSEPFKDGLADVIREGLLQPVLNPLLEAANANSTVVDPPTIGLNFLLVPTCNSPTGAAGPSSLTRSGRSFPDLRRQVLTQADSGARAAGASDVESPSAKNNAADDPVDVGDDDAMRGLSSNDVTIHVCDDSRNAKKDFVCNQDILLSQMGYFRDLTAGQSLEDVDISVHCDITIFEWLMEWIKRQEDARLLEDDDDDGETAVDNKTTENTVAALLQPDNVMSILVSASFLKMTALVDEALKFAHDNMNKILAVTQNLNCLGEPLLSRLACLYKPSEVEDLLDRRDRLHSKLYTRLILALCDLHPQPDREIFQTAATLHRCALCGKFLTKSLSRTLPCLPMRAAVGPRGEIVPRHQRDRSFSLNDFLRGLRSELKSWRKVFWRLWGMVHPLYCSLCSAAYPVYLNEFCRFHPQDPDFPTIQFKNSCEPFGRHPCCETPVFRYQPCPNQPPFPNTLPPTPTASQPPSHTPQLHSHHAMQQQLMHQGCQSRDHRVKLRSEQDAAVFRVLMAHRDIICLSPAKKSSAATGSIKIGADANSITLPTAPIDRGPVKVILEDESSRQQQDLCLIPRSSRRGLINHKTWTSMRILTPSAAPASQTNIKKSVSLISLSTLTTSMSVARRWKTYGRLKRAPKLPVKPVESESSSATEDLSEDSSSGAEDEEETGMEYEMDSKDLCIEIKLAKDKDGGSREKPGVHSLRVPGSGGGSHSTSGRESIPSNSSSMFGELALPTEPGVTPSSSAISASSGNEKSSKSSSIPETSWMRWDNDRTTRANQDHQRELEAAAMRDLAKYLGRSRKQIHPPRVTGCNTDGGLFTSASTNNFLTTTSASSGPNHPPRHWPHHAQPSPAVPSTTIISTSSSSPGGCFLKLEQDWRETHLAYLQHTRISGGGHHGSGGGGLLTVTGALARSATPSSGMLRVGSAANLRPSSAAGHRPSSSRMSRR